MLAEVRRRFVGEAIHRIDGTGPPAAPAMVAERPSTECRPVSYCPLGSQRGESVQQGRTTQSAHRLDADDVVSVALAVIDSATQAWDSTRQSVEPSTVAGAEAAGA